MERRQNGAIEGWTLWLTYVETIKWRCGHFECCDLVVSESAAVTSLLSSQVSEMCGAKRQILLGYGFQ